MAKVTLDDGGDRLYATKWRHLNTEWHVGPNVIASSYGQAEKAIKRQVSYEKGFHMTNIDVRAKRLDSKSVWPGGIDGKALRSG